ncbi:Pr6Pr family membrane protein [Subtercola lobariae]|uniref:Pr6Pr family membrane protein n=1 Tax=Subtercola lobariae TaxID=1588641 RepID=A0A917B3L4_9MICO|nr:Pr6Pr family membrane protein [Subtercola lobariae]GGF21347.1 hypothetical protein GCM10011399_13770 [Subtercola lobariae]
MNEPGRASRPVVVAARLVAGVGLTATIVIQVADRVTHHAFDPSEYFSYFTIETSLINIVVLLVGGVMALKLPRDTEVFTIIRLSAVCYAVVTAGVYNVLLRNEPYVGPYAGLSWPNEVIHVWVPLVMVLDWMLAPGRPALRYTALGALMIFPLSWLAYTLIRGAVGRAKVYPYPFLNPATGGGRSVIAYIGALAGGLLALGATTVAYGNARAVRRPSVSSRWRPVWARSRAAG